MWERGRVLAAMVEAGIPASAISYVEFSDTFYNPISKSDFDALYHEWCWALPRELTTGESLRRPIHIPETWDCENHCEDFVSYVNRAAALTALRSKTKRGGTLVGSFRYTASGIGGFLGKHRATLHINKAGTVKFFQLQTGTHFTPSEKELASCTMAGRFR